MRSRCLFVLSVLAVVSFAACGQIVFQDYFEQYDIELASDLSVEGEPSGNWTTSDMADNATRMFATSNYGGTKLWISNIDGTVLTSKGIEVNADTFYEFSAVLLAETSRTGRGVDATYDILLGSDPASATSVLGGLVAVLAVGDDEVTPNSKADQIFENNFTTGSVGAEDKLYIVITRIGTHEGLDAAWFGVDDVVLSIPTPIDVVESNGATEVSEDGVSDSIEIIANGVGPDDVEITVTPGNQLDLGQGAGAAVTVILSQEPNNRHTINVMTADDDIIREQPTGTISYTVVSADPVFDSFVIADTIVQISDNDPFCGDEDTIYMLGDLNRDCYINMLDIAVFAIDWMSCTDPAESLCL